MKDFRVAAFDIGTKTIGIAVSDPLGLFSRPLTTVRRSESMNHDLDAIEKELSKFTIIAFVLGWPERSGGERSSIMEQILGFERKIKKRYQGVVVFYEDESFSTQEAEVLIHAANLKKKRQAKNIGEVDAAAAAVILNRFMNSSDYVELKKVIDISLKC